MEDKGQTMTVGLAFWVRITELTVQSDSTVRPEAAKLHATNPVCMDCFPVDNYNYVI